MVTYRRRPGISRAFFLKSHPAIGALLFHGIAPDKLGKILAVTQHQEDIVRGQGTLLIQIGRGFAACSARAILLIAGYFRRELVQRISRWPGVSGCRTSRRDTSDYR